MTTFLSTHFQTEFLLPIIILLGIACVTTVLISLLKLKFLPTFVIEIIIGVIISRWFNEFIEAKNLSSMVDGIYIVGLSFIVFLSGYDVELDVFKDKEHTTKKHVNILRLVLWLTLGVILTSILVAIPISKYLLNDSIEAVLLMAIVFSSCFAGLVTPLVHDQGLHHTVIGKIIAVFADFSELLSIIFLSIFMIITQVTNGYVWILFIILVGLIIMRILPYNKYGHIFEKMTGGIVHLPTRLIIFLILGVVYLSELAGGEYILGAFIAGIFANSCKFSSELFKSLSRFVYGIFAPMFFVIVGTNIDIIHFVKNSDNLLLVVYLLLALWVARLPLLYLFKWFKKRAVIPMALLSSCTIVVCIAAAHIGTSLELFNHEFADALVLAGIITCIIPPILIRIEFPFDECGEKCQLKFESSIENEKTKNVL